MIKVLTLYILAIAFSIFSSPRSVWAESRILNENEIKSAYLYNFAKYVDWPEGGLPRDNASLVVCLVGNSPLNELIESLEGKVIKDRKLVVRQFSRIESLRECNILFFNASAKKSLTRILAAIPPSSILTVSDMKGFAAAGGIIEFVPVSDKIRFEINHRAAQQINLRISSHLLRLATTVIE